MIPLIHRFRFKEKCKIVNIFLSISFNIFLCAQKNRLIETVLLSTHNMFWLRNIRIMVIFDYEFLSKGLGIF